MVINDFLRIPRDSTVQKLLCFLIMYVIKTSLRQWFNILYPNACIWHSFGKYHCHSISLQLIPIIFLKSATSKHNCNYFHDNFLWWLFHPAAWFIYGMAIGLFALLIVMQEQNSWYHINSSFPGENGRQFADDIFERIFLNEKVQILIKISQGPISNIQELV